MVSIKLSNNPIKAYELGLQLIEDGDLKTARQIFEIGLDFYQDHGYFHCGLGFISLAKNDLAQAEEQFIKAAKKNVPKFETPYFELAKINPDKHLHNAINIGHQLRNRGNLNRSYATYRKAKEMQMEHRMASRSSVIQSILNRRQNTRYLEVGVFVGHNFFQIDADYKVAVDPVSRIPKVTDLREFEHYYPLTSDDFFEKNPDSCVDEGFDVVLIDGLHTYEQSKQDVLNSLDHLREGGVIIMHDCNPQSKAAAHHDLTEASQMDDYVGFWNGDVYKTIVWLLSNRQDLEVFVLDTDHGLGIVRKSPATHQLKLTDDAIVQMTYEDLKADRENLLNLKSADFIWDWIQSLAS